MPIIWSYLRRGTRGRDERIADHVCAVIATLTRFILPLLHGTPLGSGGSS